MPENTTYECDCCGNEMLPDEVKQQRFKRGDVEIIVRAHWKKRSPQSSFLCRKCIVRAVTEPDAPLPPMAAPPNLHEVLADGGSLADGGGGAGVAGAEGPRDEPGPEGRPLGPDDSNLNAPAGPKGPDGAVS